METYEELKLLSIDDLKQKYDKLSSSTCVGLNFYREEIARRESEKLNSDMVKMTSQMRNMTIAISIMTLVNVIAVIIQLCK
jgi:hypothetical protein